MVDANLPSFGTLLKHYRQAAGLTQETLAEQAGLSARGISDLERGLRRRPHPSTVRMLATALRLAPDDRARLAAAAQAAGSAPAPNLPVATTSFVGRRQELGEVRRLLGTTRLLTLIGAGGCGKTRLALEVARSVGGDFPDGVWLVDLAPLADAWLVPQAVAAVLGITTPPGEAVAATLAEALQGRRLLLVLDNAEHLAPACADLAALVLQASPDPRLLVTSRVPLGLTEETTWRVPSLSLPVAPSVQEAVGGTARQEAPTPAQVAASEAVQLFSERAAAALPGFALTAANAAAVGAICARLDGIPLAIELAAPWVRVLPVAELSTRLAADLGLLAAGSRAALPRQQTLQATLAWSYALLNPAEQLLLQRLAIFAGSFTLAATEAVGAADDLAPAAVLSLLARLVDASLVNAEPAAGRYRLLETVRVDALARLTAQGEREAARRRHATYYRDRALAALPALWDSHPERDRWFAELDRDLDNVRVAWRWADEVGDVETSLWFGGALQAYFNVRGFVAEARRRLSQTLGQAGSAPPRARAWALLAAATLARAEEDYAEAIRQAGASVALFQQVDDSPGLTHALIILGAAHAWGGDVAPARPLLEEALALSRAAEQGPGVGIPLFQLGLLALIEGDLPHAEQVLREGLAALRARGDIYRVSHLLFSLGFAELGLGRAEQARAHFHESLAIAAERRDQWALAFILEGFGCLAATQGRAELALRLAGSAAALREQEAMHVSIHAFRRLRDQLLAPAWAALDAAAAAAAWAAGRALPLDHVLALLPGPQEPAA